MSPPPGVLIQSQRVLLRSAAGQPRLVPAALLVRDGRIVSVHEGAVLKTPEGAVLEPPAGGVLDYGGDLITPAFVNAHTHLTMNFMRGRFDDLTASGNAVEQLFFRIETQLEAADVRAFLVGPKAFRFGRPQVIERCVETPEIPIERHAGAGQIPVAETGVVFDVPAAIDEGACQRVGVGVFGIERREVDRGALRLTYGDLASQSM